MKPICCKCHVEMICDKLGVYVRAAPGHAYSGDKFRCPDCGHIILSGFGTSFHVNDEDLKKGCGVDLVK